ncbi:hypothetical protein E3P92_02712 [Wallemia ichthyophaga]|uniref:DASH complex subunit SPC19 n=2 Tax=Wallemia ichthyophaga TaxID=245174 RepID=A0A4T0H576_WALIC|nr:DASH complex subunit SPC19 [Wallemia ichthyophaga EXF-994]TIA69976.1 hypothetical protein E3P91_03341 [Wallemia ichthyophaga]EOQ99181.1 DASH complex subunit SPC19 [Wallemia ichthyophaga EXF-994]TIA88095.1 hypothetical protein E3P97_03668 [Wallemia ichthyophaga]TIA97490.1 hypothetical protein E3P94_03289 [Wallemia ichthyophaga]TIA98552.1 hypothetical protein E3P95_02396 [Wallemia ichthyophaga]
MSQSQPSNNNSNNNPLQFYQSLYACQIAADGCVDEADSALSNLRSTLSDVDRFRQITEFNRHFILVSESQVNNAKTQLANDIEPQIRSLVMRAEVALKSLQKKHAHLKLKAQRRHDLATKAKSNLTAEDAGVLQKLSLQKERYEIMIKDEQAQLDELEQAYMAT